jgi:hypothetical protein
MGTCVRETGALYPYCLYLFSFFTFYLSKQTSVFVTKQVLGTQTAPNFTQGAICAA